jgi:hypothetical protein
VLVVDFKVEVANVVFFVGMIFFVLLTQLVAKVVGRGLGLGNRLPKGNKPNRSPMRSLFEGE